MRPTIAPLSVSNWLPALFLTLALTAPPASAVEYQQCTLFGSYPCHEAGQVCTGFEECGQKCVDLPDGSTECTTSFCNVCAGDVLPSCTDVDPVVADCARFVLGEPVPACWANVRDVGTIPCTPGFDCDTFVSCHINGERCSHRRDLVGGVACTGESLVACADLGVGEGEACAEYLPYDPLIEPCSAVIDLFGDGNFDYRDEGCHVDGTWCFTRAPLPGELLCSGAGLASCPAPSTLPDANACAAEAPLSGTGRVLQQVTSPTARWAADELTLAATQAVLDVHELPGSDRDLVLSYARGSVRAHLFAELIALIQKPAAERTAEEEDLLGYYRFALGDLHRRQAEFSEVEYAAYVATGECLYVPPEGFTFEYPASCVVPLPIPPPSPAHPSVEEFQAYGYAHVAGELVEDGEAFAVSGAAAKAIAFGIAAVAAIAISTGVFFAVLFTGIGATIITAVFPFTFVPVWLLVTGTVIGGSGVGVLALGIAGPVGFAILAIVGSIFAIIDVVEYDEFVSEVTSLVENVDYDPDLTVEIETDRGMSELYHVFIQSSLPEQQPSAALPSPSASDPKFVVLDEFGDLLGVHDTISPSYGEETGDLAVSQVVGRRGGWFASTITTTAPLPTEFEQVVEGLALSFSFVDWAGRSKEAWAIGTGFVLVDPEDVENDTLDQSEAVDELQYLDADGEKRIVRIVLDATPPTVALDVEPGLHADEGSSFSLLATAFDDQSGVAGSGWSILPDGAGALLAALDHAADVNAVDDGFYIVEFEAFDGFGNRTAKNVTLTVANVAPVVTPLALSAPSVLVGLPIAADAAWSDVGSLDTHVASLIWGDGSEVVIPNASELVESHTYAEAGLFTVQLVVADDDGGSSIVSAELLVQTPAEVAEALAVGAAGLPTSQKTQEVLAGNFDAVVAALEDGDVGLARTRLGKLIERLVKRSALSASHRDALPRTEADSMLLQTAAFLVGLDGQVCPTLPASLSEIADRVANLATSQRTRSRLEQSLGRAIETDSVDRARAALKNAIRTLIAESNRPAGDSNSVGLEETNVLVCDLAAAITTR